MIFIINGGRRNGECVEADLKEGNKLFRSGFTTKQDVAADGSVMTSKVPKTELVFVAEKGEEIAEFK
jgi:hypothetical protein